MKRDHFERLVSQAVAELPQTFRGRLQNVVVIIEDAPSHELLEEMGMARDEALFGLYEGTPLTVRGVDAPLYPDRIWIFQRPIEAECHTEEEIKHEIKTTIVHEVAHFFGLDDEYLEELGY